MSQQQQPSINGYPVPLDNPSVDKSVNHQQPPITSCPPVWDHNNNNYPTATTASNYNPMMNDQQQPPVQNYPTSTTSNYNPMMMNNQQPPVQNYQQPASTTASNYNPMMNEQQQPPVQNYPTATTSNYNPMMMNQQPPVQNYQQPASTTNAAVGSNFFMGNHQQPPITSYPPVWNNNNNNNNDPTATMASNYNPMMNQQQPPPQNYSAATTINYNNPMMMNQPQPPPAQNYQPASTTNVAVGSNFFMGHPASNGLPAYKQTVAVIGSQYCSPNPFDLTITRKMKHLSSGNFIVEDVNGNLLFKVKDGIQLLRDRRVLLDAKGKPVVTMQKKIMTAHNRWNVCKGDSRELNDFLFCVKETSIIQLRTKLDVFLASNGNEGIGDFSLKGSWGERSCMIYGGDAKSIIAQMHKKVTVGSVLVGKDTFTVTVYPNIDCAFIVSLLVILDDINRQVI